MAVAVYQCDTCKRFIDRLQNKQGVDVVGKCIITNGCKGTLRLFNVNESQATIRPPTPHPSLRDWSKRKALHTHTQLIPARVWRVTHNMNAAPAIQVFVDVNRTGIQADFVEVIPEQVSFISPNELEITIPASFGISVGVVQCVIRSSKTAEVMKQDVPDPPIQLSNNLTFVAAIPITTQSTQLDELDITLMFKVVGSDVPIEMNQTIQKPAVGTPWQGVTIVSFKGQAYHVFAGTLDFGADILANDISDGAEITFADANGVPFTTNSGFLLLGNAPFTIADRNFAEVIDLSVSNVLTLQQQQLYFSNKSTQPIFPTIKIVN